jgi:cell division protein FtsQ
VVPERGRVQRRWRLVRARSEAVPASLRRMYQRVPRPPARSATPWIIVAVSAVLVAVLGWVFLGTAVFGVRRVEVTGSTIASADEVRSMAAVAPGTPLARVDTGAVAERVRTLAPVADVSVVRAWPDTLIIAITERVPIAAVAADGAYQILDAEGVVFRTAAARPGDLVLIRVAAPGPTDPATRAVLRVIGSLTPELRSQLRLAAAESAISIRLELRGDRVIIWGDAEQNETKALVATSLLAQPGRTIDVSAPEVVTVS